MAAERIVGIFGDDWDEEAQQPGFRTRRLRLGRRLGSEQLGASVYLLPPGERSFPFHFHHANEELLLVLDGEVWVRGHDGEATVTAGEAMLFPRGPAGAHQLINRGERPVRFLLVSGMVAPEIAYYPDSRKFGLFAGAAPGARAADGFKAFIADAPVDYFEGEPPPAR